jgi:hypothetical protein
VRVRGRETEGKRADEDPHPKAELRRQLVVAAERRGGGCNGDQNAASMAAAARVKGREAATAGLTSPRARAAFYRAAGGLGVRARGDARRVGRAVAGLNMSPSPARA